MSDPSVPWNPVERRKQILATVREQFSNLADSEDAVGSLALWFRWLMADISSGVSAEMRLPRSLRSPADNPVAWCTRESQPLPAELHNDLVNQKSTGDDKIDLKSLTLYVLGRAAMRCAMTEPSGSYGLTLAYEWFKRLDGGYSSSPGADDEILAAETLPNIVADELVGEGRRLGENPQQVADALGRAMSGEAIRQTGELKSLEATVAWRFADSGLDMPFGRIVLVISKKWPKFGAELLGMLKNPALVAGALRDHDLCSFRVLISLLPFAPAAFDDKGCWSGSCVARILLHAFENLCMERVRQELRRAAHDSEYDIVEFSKTIVGEVGDLVEAAGQRPDRDRLWLEWLAHLVWSFLVSLSGPWSDPRNRQFRIVPPHAMLNAVADAVRHAPFSEPQSVWDLFDGGALVLRESDPVAADFRQHVPVWSDSHGKEDALIPIAVSVCLISNDERALAAAGKLAFWTRLAFARLEQQPHLDMMARQSSGGLAHMLAWPFSRIRNPAGALRLLWEDAGWRRTRTRFAEVEQASELIQCCAVCRSSRAPSATPNTYAAG